MLDQETIDEIIKGSRLSGLVPSAESASTRYTFGSLEPGNMKANFVWDTSKFKVSLDLKPLQDQVENQGSYNACTGFAISTQLEWQDRLATGIKRNYSEYFGYFNSRNIGNYTGGPIQDVGAIITVCYAAYWTYGVCLKSYWDTLNDVNTKPNEQAYTEALNHKLERYELIARSSYNIFTQESIQRDLDADIQCALNCNMPVVVGIPLTAEFYNLTGPLEDHPLIFNPAYVNPQSPNFAGYHCMCCIGYFWSTKFNERIYIFENSWGPAFGDGGFVGLLSSFLRVNAFELFAVRKFNGNTFEIPFDYYKWTKDTDLADGTSVAIDTNGPCGIAYRLYQATLNRTPDLAGLGYHYKTMQLGLTQKDVALFFINSDEFKSIYGNLTNNQFVTLLYHNVLKRDPDPSGFDYHVGNLNRGFPKEDTVLVFSESQEFKEMVLPKIKNGMQYVKYNPV